MMAYSARKMCWGVTILTVLMLTGCMVGPDYKLPRSEVNKAWVEFDDLGVKQDRAVNVQWWREFNDPVLTRLVDEAYRNNLDLRTAGVRVRDSECRCPR